MTLVRAASLLVVLVGLCIAGSAAASTATIRGCASGRSPPRASTFTFIRGRKRWRAGWRRSPRRSRDRVDASSARRADGCTSCSSIRHDLSNGWATPGAVQHDRDHRRGAVRREHDRQHRRLAAARLHARIHAHRPSRARREAGSAACGTCSAARRCSIPTCSCRCGRSKASRPTRKAPLTGYGRMPAGDFRMIVTRPRQSGDFEPHRSGKRRAGRLAVGPGTVCVRRAVPRLLGEEVRRRVASTRWLTRRQAICPISASPAFRKVSADRSGDLWNEFEAESREQSDSPSDSRDRQEADPSRLLGYRTAVRAGGGSITRPRTQTGFLHSCRSHRATPRRAESRTSISARAWASPATRSCSTNRTRSAGGAAVRPLRDFPKQW